MSAITETSSFIDTYMRAVATARVDVAFAVDLNAVADPGVYVCKHSAVRERFRLRVYVECVSEFGVLD